MSVYLDTSALYAILDADDDCHSAAKAKWISLLEEGHGLFTSNYVLVETVALLQSRLGVEAVGTFAADIIPMIETFWADEGVHRSAQHSLLVAHRRQLSLVDCVSFEVIRRLQLSEVFCFDPHFADQGFRTIP
jgi:predicted nucleic acid-binding protein